MGRGCAGFYLEREKKLLASFFSIVVLFGFDSPLSRYIRNTVKRGREFLGVAGRSPPSTLATRLRHSMDEKPRRGDIGGGG